MLLPIQNEYRTPDRERTNALFARNIYLHVRLDDECHYFQNPIAMTEHSILEPAANPPAVYP